jgi:hypothetical protein
MKLSSLQRLTTGNGLQFLSIVLYHLSLKNLVLPCSSAVYTVKASNFGLFLASSVVSLDETCTKK